MFRITVDPRIHGAKTKVLNLWENLNQCQPLRPDPGPGILRRLRPGREVFYRREKSKIPERFIRGYHLRDPKTGQDGPWLAALVLDQTVVTL